MANYKEIRLALEKRKYGANSYVNLTVSDINNSRAISKSLLNNKLFNEGQGWFLAGKKLEDATDIVEYCGTLVAKKNQNNFKHGFFAGAYDYGYKAGYKGTNIESIPEYISNIEKFSGGYEAGAKAKERDILKKTKSR